MPTVTGMHMIVEHRVNVASHVYFNFAKVLRKDEDHNKTATDMFLMGARCIMGSR